MIIGRLVDTVFRFNRLCECHLYTALRNNLNPARSGCCGILSLVRFMSSAAKPVSTLTWRNKPASYSGENTGQSWTGDSVPRRIMLAKDGEGYWL
jgi:hypothetical protein